MPDYTLKYFPFRGRGEVARLIFAARGIEFTNEVVEFKDWSTLKPTITTGSLPVLYVDGIEINESLVICRFLAREFDLAGKSSLEQAHVDQILAIASEVKITFAKLHFEKNEEKKISDTKSVQETFPKTAETLIKMMDKNGPYAVGDSLTVADLALYDTIHSAVDSKLLDIKKEFPRLIEHYKTIGGISKIREYVDNRPHYPI